MRSRSRGPGPAGSRSNPSGSAHLARTQPVGGTDDITKDHPDIALDRAERWLTRGSGATWVVRHGVRTLVKHGDDRALALLGVNMGSTVELVDLALDRTHVADGAGARGAKAPTVFKLTRRRLEPGQPVTLNRPGPHQIDTQVKRRILGSASFEVRPTSAGIRLCRGSP